MRGPLLFPLIIIIVVIISFPRFNQQDLFGLKKFTGKAEDYNITRGYYLAGDAVDYLYCVKFFRGELDRSHLVTPYVYRFLVPYCASFLPVRDPLTALNVMNVIFFLLSLFVLYFFILSLGFKKEYAFLGIFFLGISFFTFYYLTFGNVDSGVILFVLIGLNAIIKRNNFLFLFALTFGVLVKETAFILIPYYFIHQFFFRKSFRLKAEDVLFYSLVFIVPIFELSIVRLMYRDLPAYFWTPSIELILNNIVRVKAYFSPILTLGIPGALSLVFIYFFFKKNIRIKFSDTINENNQLKLQKYFLSIFFVSSLLGLYGYLAAVADGRAFMPMYLVSIILALMVIRFYKKREVIIIK